MLELKDLITPAELAAQTGINRFTLLARIRKRNIPTLRKGGVIFLSKKDAQEISYPVTKPFGGAKS